MTRAPAGLSPLTVIAVPILGRGSGFASRHPFLSAKARMEGMGSALEPMKSNAAGAVRCAGR